MSLLDFLAANHWAMEANAFSKMLMVIERHAEGVKLSPSEIEAAIGRAPTTPHPRDRSYEVSNGVALIPIRGILAKHADQVGGISQPSGMSFETIQKNIRTALADGEVRSILLHIESPGGSVDGTQATAQVIAAAAKQKRTVAYIDGLGASAAYWLACQADEIFASETALVGSIGTVTTIADTKAAAEKQGVRVTVIRSGPLKAGVMPGEAAGDAQVAAMQKIVDDLGAIFAAAVGDARDLAGAKLEAIRDGNVHVAAQAQSLGLIDGIRSFEAVLSDMEQANSPGRRLAASHHNPSAGARPAATGPQPMKIEAQRLAGLIAEHPSHAVLISSMAAGNTAEKREPATEDQILSAIQGAQVQNLTAQIATLTTRANDQIAAHATTIKAKDDQILALQAELKDAKEAAALAKPKGTGALEGSPIPDPKASDPIKAYDAKLAELRAEGDKTPSTTIARKFPDLNAAFVAAHNSQPAAAKEGAK
jgi:signal peptide peptidase SppA